MFIDIAIMIYMEIITRVFLSKKDLNLGSRIKNQLYLDLRADNKINNKIRI